MLQLLSICDRSYIVEIMLIVKIFFKLACYIVPPIIIIITIIGFTKPVIEGKEESLKENGQLLVKRLIAGLLIMFLPTLINYVFTSIVKADDVEFIACMESASKEKVEALKQKEQAEEEAKKKQQEKEDQKQQQEAYKKEQQQKENQKKLYEEEMKRREERNQNTAPISGNLGVEGANYKNKLASMSTPTIAQIESAASSAGVSKDYLKIVIGTTYNEGYFNDPYLYYGWASAMLNNHYTIEQMQGWDPSRSGEANFYSQTNINKGYNSASPEVLKSVYLALTERNTKIVECNGMYQSTPSSYNLLYSSSVYNCSIYETK